MAVIVPEGEGVATFVFNCAGIAKDMTFSIGVKPTVIDGAAFSEMPELIYNNVTDNPAPEGEPIGNAAQIGNSWTFQGVEVMEMTGTGPLVHQFFDPITGSTSGGTLPPNCSILMNKQTAFGGRKFRGRCYLPPFAAFEADWGNSGSQTGVAAGVLGDAWNASLAAWLDLGILPLLHHSDGSAGTTLTGVSIGTLIATQRRRIR